MLAVKEFFEFNGVPDERRVSLVVITFQEVVVAWWQHLKQRRRQQGKLKNSSWEWLLKEMLDAFVLQKYTIGWQPQNWRQGSYGCDEKFRKFWQKKSILGNTEWCEESTTGQLGFYFPTTNPYTESVNGEFQESKIIDEEFEPECVEDEDLSQGFVDWDSPPTYDEEDSIEEPLASNLKEEHEEDGFFPMFGCLYPDEEDQLGEEETTDDIADHEEDDIADYEKVDEGLSDEMSNYNEEEVEYVDFLGVEDILSSPNNDVDEFYTDEENYLFIREVTADPFLSIFMACGGEKEREKYGKSKVLPSGVWGVHDRHQGIPLMGSVTLILGCCLVLILRKGE